MKAAAPDDATGKPTNHPSAHVREPTTTSSKKWIPGRLNHGDTKTLKKQLMQNLTTKHTDYTE